MSIIDLTAYRQERKDSLQEALGMDQTTVELLTINGDLEEETDLMELARQVNYPPLYCVKQGCVHPVLKNRF